MKERSQHSAQAMEDLSSLSIADYLTGNELTPREERAITAIDVLNIPILDKRILFGAFIYFEQGIFRNRDVLGLSPDQSVATRDRVRTSTRYIELWDKFLFLQNPHFTEVALSKKEKTQHAKIAEVLEITKAEVDDISKLLIAKGIIMASGRGKTNAKKFGEFLRQVEEIDSPLLSDEEIAKRLIESPTRIKRARKRLRDQGRIKKRTPKDVARSQGKVRKLLGLRAQVKELAERGHTTRQISAITKASYYQVKHQRSIIANEQKTS